MLKHKLINNSNNKYNYTVHIRNLKFHLELGLKLIKINKILEVEQSKFMESYIMFNINMLKMNLKQNFLN